MSSAHAIAQFKLEVAPDGDVERFLAAFVSAVTTISHALKAAFWG
jgi:hypothetical protein